MPFSRRIVGLGPGDQARQRARLGDQARGERKDVHAPAPAPQEHGEKLGVTQRGRPETFEPFLGALAHGEIAQPERREGAAVIHSAR